MNIYRVDQELGLVFIVIKGREILSSKLSLFKQPINSRVEYILTKQAGE